MGPIHVCPQDSAYGLAHSSCLINSERGREKSEEREGERQDQKHNFPNPHPGDTFFALSI